MFEPTEKEIGTPYAGSGRGKRLIFLNIKLNQHEIDGLRQLHEALASEEAVTTKGEDEFPSYVRLHALRILQQAKFDLAKALPIMLTHLNMRVKMFPLSDTQLMADLKKGLMYWHGRDKC